MFNVSTDSFSVAVPKKPIALIENGGYDLTTSSSFKADGVFDLSQYLPTVEHVRITPVPTIPFIKPRIVPTISPETPQVIPVSAGSDSYFHVFF